MLDQWRKSLALEHRHTRSEQGARAALALLTRLIETCRRRTASAWQYLGSLIVARKGLPLPAIPLTLATA